MSIKAVAFDIDGTLYPNRAMYFHSIGFYLTHLKTISAFSKVRHEIRLVKRVEDFSALQTSLLAKEMSLSEGEAASRIENVLYGEWENIFKRVKPFSGVKELLASLREKGLKLGALSDFPVGNKLSYFGLSDCWDVIMASHESGRLKPAKEPFLELARRLDLEPSEILYVGNNFSYDVIGSNGAGMESAYIAPAWKKRRHEADYQFSNYMQLAEIIDGILSHESDPSDTCLSG